uniref:Uncharacterized protein n=1 Tax=Anguilla anguilla TaxID=7936 RepID=A0A0E9Y0D7_ANGAN
MYFLCEIRCASLRSSDPLTALHQSFLALSRDLT